MQIYNNKYLSRRRNNLNKQIIISFKLRYHDKFYKKIINRNEIIN